MNKYQDAKIYKIVVNDYSKCYIGSTCETLSQRFARHRYNHRNAKKWNTLTSANRLFDEFGYDNCKIELIENFPCNSRDELLRREGYHIKNSECINRCVAGRTISEWKQDNKEDYDNKRKNYSEQNRDYIQQRSSEHYHQYKDTINQRRKETVTCDCGSTFRKVDKCRHETSKKHKDYINKQQSE